MSDDVCGRLNSEVDERYGNSVDNLGGRIDDADAGHTELHPVIAGGLDLCVSQHRQQDVIDTIDLIVNEVGKQSSTNKARVQSHLLREKNKKLSCCCDSRSYGRTIKPVLVTAGTAGTQCESYGKSL